MEYADFYDIAVYLNGINRNVFTQKEVACYAYDYLSEFETSKQKGKPTTTIQELMMLLIEDDSEECDDWLNQMTTELRKHEEDFIISGIIFKHGENDYELWEEFVLSKENSQKIKKILKQYETEGCSVRGTREEIAEELQ